MINKPTAWKVHFQPAGCRTVRRDKARTNLLDILEGLGRRKPRNARNSIEDAEDYLVPFMSASSGDESSKGQSRRPTQPAKKDPGDSLRLESTRRIIHRQVSAPKE
jgi:hypothetical protein